MTQRVSDRFIEEISGSHTVYSYVDAHGPNREVVRLKVFTGSVNVDRTAQYRRSMTCTLVDPDGELTPSGAAGLLTPYGTELRPYRGVQYSDGTTEVVPLGAFRLSQNAVIETAALNNPNGGSYTGITMTLSAFDRSRKIARDKFTAPYPIAIGTNIIVAIQQILGRTFANLQYDAISSSVVTTSAQVFSVGDDPWVSATALAASIGCDLYFDAWGTVVIAPTPSIHDLSSPDFTYIEGVQNTMTDLGATYTDDPGYNGVVVTGASVGNTTTAVQATAWDDHPASPTYYLGEYGKVPMFVNDPNISTAAQAQNAASAQLAALLGTSAQLTATASTNPSYEAGDTVAVVRSPMNVAGLYLLDAFTVPMGGSIAGHAQSLTMRQKQG